MKKLKRAELVLTGDFHTDTTAVFAVVSKAPNVFVMHGELVRVVKVPREDGQGGSWRAQKLTSALLQSVVAAQVRVIKGDGKPGVVPTAILNAIIEDEIWSGVRSVKAIRDVPLVVDDGQVISGPRYDARTQVFFAPTAAKHVVPLDATCAAARRAYRYLADLVAAFPFGDAADVAGWVALVLTPFALDSARLLVPFFAIYAESHERGPGLGKTELAKAASFIFTGEEAELFPPTGSSEEWRKRLSAIARHGAKIAIVDNMNGRHDDAQLAQFSTAGRRADRGLGTGSVRSEDARVVIVFTGNAITMKTELARRYCLIKLDDTQTKRAEFSVPLAQLVAKRRRECVTAALTILSAHARAGFPQPAVSTLRSYEEWHRRVRAAVVWASGIDPMSRSLGTRDPLEQLHSAFLKKLRVLSEGQPFLSTDVAAWAKSSGAIRSYLRAIRLPRKKERIGEHLASVAAGERFSESQSALKLIVEDKARPRKWQVVKRA